MQHHQLVTLTRVLYSTPMRRLNPHRRLPAMNTSWPLARPGPHPNRVGSLNPLNYQTRQT
ncbi:hypothetical protein [Neopusillimonas aestuarii]|uniref:hypothetical protein n=1 Tax=Neopusillimonas aestuarii TaxID=2716226 RepID=UPI001D1874EB|nr:hypothetical protein [Pusillimonas sp. DMV24BSW_D]